MRRCVLNAPKRMKKSRWNTRSVMNAQSQSIPKAATADTTESETPKTTSACTDEPFANNDLQNPRENETDEPTIKLKFVQRVKNWCDEAQDRCPNILMRDYCRSIGRKCPRGHNNLNSAERAAIEHLHQIETQRQPNQHAIENRREALEFMTGLADLFAD
jgi:hypothetical protein